MIKEKTKKKTIKKKLKSIRVNLINLQSWILDRDNPSQKENKKKNHETQGAPNNLIQKDEIKKKPKKIKMKSG